MPYNSEDKVKFTKEILEIAEENSITSEIKKVFFFESFPVDARHNAKIFRDQLSELANDNKSLQNAA